MTTRHVLVRADAALHNGYTYFVYVIANAMQSTHLPRYNQWRTLHGFLSLLSYYNYYY